MNGGPSPEKSSRRFGLDLALILLLLVAGLGVRGLFVRAVVFAPLDDPAFYLITAENVVTGRGLVVDVLWSYHTPSPTIPHPSHEHWMPLTTGLIAAAFAIHRALSGAAEFPLLWGQLPGLILGSLLVPLTYVVGRRNLPGGEKNRGVAFVAALLVAANATLSYQSASADSSAPFAFLAAWTLAVAVHPPGAKGSYLGAGLLAGLVYLTRSDGLLVLAAIPLAWWLLPPLQRSLSGLPDQPAAQAAWELWPRERGATEERQPAPGPRLSNVLDLAVAFGLVVAPWLVRNYLAFGTPLPGSILNQAWLSQYAETFNFQAQPTWQNLLAQGWTEILRVRGQALLHNAGVLLLGTFPWGLLALPGLWLFRRKWSFWTPLVYTFLLFFVTAILFPISSMSGTFYHSFGATVPFLALAAGYATQRGLGAILKAPPLARTAFIALSAGLVLLAGYQAFMALPGIRERHTAEKAQFEAAAAWLAEHAGPGEMVMTSQPYTLNYASRQPAIALPAAEPPEAAWEAAQRYGARYLVITESFGIYPEVLHEQSQPYFQRLEGNDGIEFYAINPRAP